MVDDKIEMEQFKNKPLTDHLRDMELTYGEFREAKIKLLEERYNKDIDEILRNINLENGDIENNILSDKFFQREDISEDKKLLLKNKTNLFLEELNKFQ